MGQPETVIRVENLGKRYLIRHAGENGRYQTLRDTVVTGARSLGQRLLRRGPTVDPRVEEFWALKDVSFEVKRGEVVGIIGRNGAGKSTLLKLLSRITEPTTGRIELDGRVASLLEVGTGFHQELTGRENIYLNGAILGMSRSEIRRKFDEIVAFAEVEKFLDTPVKRYSSGMYVRLAFAVAAHLEPEILIVDEVLAVGDAQFQKKCLGKMGDVARGGRTVLFVSHNMAVVQALCKRAVRLQAGRLVGCGPIHEEVVGYQSEFKQTSEQTLRSFAGKSFSLGRFDIRPETIMSGAPVTVTLELCSHTAILVSSLCVMLHTAANVRVALIDLRRTDGPYRLRGGQSLSLEMTIEDLRVTEGEYALGLFVQTQEETANWLDVARLEVLPRPFEGRVVPYDVVHRGYIELDYRVNDVRFIDRDPVGAACSAGAGTTDQRAPND